MLNDRLIVSHPVAFLSSLSEFCKDDHSEGIHCKDQLLIHYCQHFILIFPLILITVNGCSDMTKRDRRAGMSS